ncbi:MAG: NAD(P)-binding domain-containing protein [Oscillospiraceae bacterium]|nr:NAD(P)-binding domain-containing protein [Oscillospiraceae bacterium]
MKIGVIGTGIIASAVVTGFCLKSTGHEFYLSPRNAERAASLAAKFGECTVCKSNQEVLDKSDWVFICLHKKDFDTLRELKYESGLKVINMSAEMRLSDLSEITGPTDLLAHVIPLPFIVAGIGPLLVYPENKEVQELFEAVGDVYSTNSQKDVHTLQIISGLMSAYNMLLHEIVKFSDERGVEHDTSVKFLCSMFSALCTRAAGILSCDLIELAHEMTPGGYNEQAMNELLENGAISAWRTSLDTLLARLENSQT